ncbi:tripartite tricarboxylate transporter substrate binding protein [Bordetella petrii]|nr:tripartite tricarboxylate transporter substrate binding protein [Bordetella petrii]
MNRFFCMLAAAAALAIGAIQPVLAEQNYPSRPIRIVIGFAAGGGTDAMLREIAAELSNKLNVPVVVENRPGANGNIANETVARAKGDGYTLLYNTSSLVLSPYLYSDLKYDFRKDLKPVSMTINMPLVLAANRSVPVKTVQEFADYLKKNPGAVNYGSAGKGNITHLATVQLLDSIKANAVHVPYRSEAPAVADLLGGHVQFYMGTSAVILPLVKDGQLTGLAVTSMKRLPGADAVPTLAETILPGVEFGAWSGIMAPAGTPDEVIAKLNASVNQVLADPKIREKIASSGAEVRASSVREYADFIESEYQRWGQAVKAAGIQPE